MEQPLGKAVTVVSQAHLVAEPLESLAIGGRDLRIHGVEKRQGGQPCDPRAAVIAVDPEHVGLVHTELRRRDRVNAVAIPEMSEQPPGNRLVVHPRTEPGTLHPRQVTGAAATRQLRPDAPGRVSRWLGGGVGTPSRSIQ